MYDKKALELHRPSFLICESDILLEAASVAARILKECPQYLPLSCEHMI